MGDKKKRQRLKNQKKIRGGSFNKPRLFQSTLRPPPLSTQSVQNCTPLTSNDPRRSAVVTVLASADDSWGRSSPNDAPADPSAAGFTVPVASSNTFLESAVPVASSNPFSDSAQATINVSKTIYEDASKSLDTFCDVSSSSKLIKSPRKIKKNSSFFAKHAKKFAVAVPSLSAVGSAVLYATGTSLLISAIPVGSVLGLAFIIHTGLILKSNAKLSKIVSTQAERKAFDYQHRFFDTSIEEDHLKTMSSEGLNGPKNDPFNAFDDWLETTKLYKNMSYDEWIQRLFPDMSTKQAESRLRHIFQGFVNEGLERRLQEPASPPDGSKTNTQMISESAKFKSVDSSTTVTCSFKCGLSTKHRSGAGVGTFVSSSNTIGPFKKEVARHGILETTANPKSQWVEMTASNGKSFSVPVRELTDKEVMQYREENLKEIRFSDHKRLKDDSKLDPAQATLSKLLLIKEGSDMLTDILSQDDLAKISIGFSLSACSETDLDKLFNHSPATLPFTCPYEPKDSLLTKKTKLAETIIERSKAKQFVALNIAQQATQSDFDSTADLSVTLMSTSLVTPSGSDRLGSEHKMLERQIAAFEGMESLTDHEKETIFRGIKKDDQPLFNPDSFPTLNVATELYNFGVQPLHQFGAKKDLEYNLKAWNATQARINGKLKLVDSSNDKHEAAKLLIQKIGDSIKDRSPLEVGDNTFLTPVLIQALDIIVAGDDPSCLRAFNCKSGKDRTSMLDLQLHCFLDQVNQYMEGFDGLDSMPMNQAIEKTINVFQSLASGDDDQQNPELKEIQARFRGFLEDDVTGSFEIQAKTQGGPGYKLDNSVIKRFFGIESKYQYRLISGAYGS